MEKKIIRIATLTLSLQTLLRGQLSFISKFYKVIQVGSKEKRDLSDEDSKNEDISVYYVEMTRKITPFKDIISLWNLYRLFKKEKPFIVHSHTPKAGTLSMLAAFLAKVPNRLHTIAGLPLVEAKGFKRILLNFVEKVTYACATKIYPNSYGLSDIILENKFTNKRKLKVLANGSSNGINIDYFHPDFYKNEHKINLRKELNISKNDIVFIFVGRLVKDKGINELISAFIRLNKDNSKLLLVGDYEEKLDPLLPETIKSINTNKNIITTGWVNDVRPYFSISNILTFPSYREGFPNVVMQAGAMGLPSIVSNINGCNEIIVEGKNGTIIPSKSEDALYKKMKAFYEENITFSYEECRNLIVSRYEQQKVWKAILDEYNQL